MSNTTIYDAEQALEKALEPLYGKEEAAAIAVQALGFITGKNKAGLLAARKEPIDRQQQLSAAMMLDELTTGKPLQYITGECFFYGLKFKVNKSVLIPRPETEELVEWVASHLACRQAGVSRLALPAGRQVSDICILDIGTGSGCIAVSLAKCLRGAEVWACDISADALELAMHNAVLNETRLHFRQADILDESTWHQFPELDVIVSNPPYITESEKRSMHINVLEHEPAGALFVPDKTPLLFYRSIARFARKKLKKGGRVYVEINESYGKESAKLFENEKFTGVELKKDMNGKGRMLKAVISYE